MTAKLIITWTAPSETNAIDSIVLYKKKDATNCEETLTGELIYETSDFTTQGSRYIDNGVLEGQWRYAAFSKNPGGLSPCATDTYTVILDSAPTVNSYLQDITAWDSSQDMTIDLSSVFVDADGDPITKTAISSNSGVVSVTVNGDNLVLSFTGGQSGTAIITVTGESNGKTVTDQFAVVVTADGDSDNDGIPDSQDPYYTQTQLINFAKPDDRAVIDGNLVLSATATSGLTVTYSSTSPYVTFNGSTAIFANSGAAFSNVDVTIKASQAGGLNSSNDTDWHAAPDVSKTFKLSDPDSDNDGVPDSRQHLCQNFSASASSTPNTAWNGSSGTATATASGGSGSYTYLWNSGETTQAINGLYPNTTHTVTITDSNGCTESASTTVAQGASDPCPGFSASASSTPNTVWNGSSGTATATASGGSGSYTYLWNSGETTQAINGLYPNTTHTVTITDSTGCTGIASTTVAQGASAPDPCAGFSVSANSTAPGWSGTMPYVPVANGTATAIVSGGSGTRSYLWSNGATTQTITGLSPNTTHTVTVTTSTGCEASASATVGSTTHHPCAGVFSWAGTLTPPTPGQSDGSLYIQVFGTSTPPISVTFTEVSTGIIKYSNPNLPVKQFTVNNLGAGNYKLAMTDIGPGGTACNFVNGQGELLGDYTIY